ncbi:hypothetical protein LG52_3793 [Geobacillus kaustophilus]|uniref:Uncharacterized protein n=1 Tax=Geobacillus kaustophilus TaxID=1462 RepID=A0A0D8C7V4_GEOKU|nr:hypothetical protein LG52_3793 [Geobacillus kaustophilus]
MVLTKLFTAFQEKISSLFQWRKFLSCLIQGLCHFLNHMVLIDDNRSRWKQGANRLMIRFPHVKNHRLDHFFRQDILAQQVDGGVTLAIGMHSHDRSGSGIHQYSFILMSLFYSDFI